MAVVTGRCEVKFRLQLLVESDAGEIVSTEEVAQLERHSLGPEEVGLSLAEAKQMLGNVQRAMIQEQIAEYLDQQSRCGDCGRTLARKGQHEIVFRTFVRRVAADQPALLFLSVSKSRENQFQSSRAAAAGTNRTRAGLSGDEIRRTHVLWLDCRHPE